ncbi:MAG TPA: tetratricopeptide repeat protein [Anaeromyxobacteraceae bacterium]
MRAMPLQSTPTPTPTSSAALSDPSALSPSTPLRTGSAPPEAARSRRAPTSTAAAALLFALAACLPSPRVHPRAAEEIARGYRYLAQDDAERAEIAFAHALEFNEDIPEAQNGAGVVARRRGQLEEARRRFEHAVKSAPDFAEGHVNLGELSLVRGDDDEAEGHFRAALAIDPDLLPARLDLARALLHRGGRDAGQREALFAAARREYLHLLEARPDVAEAWQDLGFLDFAAGHHGRAEEEYRRAAELAPGYAEALHGWCISLVRLGRCAEGARACRRCLDAAPGAERCQVSLRGAEACAAAPERRAAPPLEQAAPRGLARPAPTGSAGASGGGERS